jgi:cobalt-zinc-cadmium resistance protein CzcA
VFARLSHGTPVDRFQTVRDAVLEVATPVVFGICIIILVFLPLMTLEGMEGKIFSPLAYTIAIALAISLVLSLTLSTVLSFYLLKGGSEHDTFLVRMLKAPFRWQLQAAVNNEKKTIAVAVALFAGSLALVPFLGTSFIPELKEGTISPNADRAPSISLEESIKMEMEAHRLLRDLPGVKSLVSRLGRGESPVDPAGYNETDMMISLKPMSERGTLTQDQIAEQARTRLSKLPGVNIVLAQPISDRVDEMVTGARADVAVKIFGDDLDVLLAKGNAVAKAASSIRGTADVKVDRVMGQSNLNIQIDRQAIARHGLNVADVNDTVEAAVGGRAATEIYEGERRFQAVVRLPERLRTSVRDIESVLLRAPDGAQLPLSSVAQVTLLEGASQIKREQGKRRVIVGVNVKDRDLGSFVAELQQRVQAEVKLPSGYYFQWGGQFENMERAQKHLKVIVPITIGAIFFLLFVLFGSVRFAALIILVLPFASIGGIAALYLSGEYLSVPASVGFIALWGIAVLNGVVLVSYVRSLRQGGMPRRQALVEGALARFRPVMMTAAVAALGLLPFLFATGPGSEVQRPLAIVVIGGLISSTALTLLVVPALYGFFDDTPAGTAS